VKLKSEPCRVDEPSCRFKRSTHTVEDPGFAAEVEQCADGCQQQVGGESISGVGGHQRRFSFSRSQSMQFRA